MPLSVECYFEPKTQDGLMKLCRALSTAGILPDRKLLTPRPCIELGVWEYLDLPEFERRFEAFIQTVRPIPITLASMGMFPSAERRLFLGPIVTHDLLNMHERLHEQMQPFADQLHRAYEVGRWHPHVTLGTGADLNRLMQCAAILRELNLPITTHIVEVAIRTVSAER